MGFDPKDGTFPDYAQERIEGISRNLVGHYGWRSSDQPEIAGELSLRLWEKLRHFDSSKGDLESFVDCRLRQIIASLIEQRMAIKRGQRANTCSVDEVVKGHDGKEVSLAEVLEGADGTRRLGLPTSDFRTRSDLKEEVRAFLKRLPDDLRDLCRRLLDNPNLTDISRETGIPRGTLYERREELRRLMERAGLLDYLSSSGASHRSPVEDR